MFHDVNNLVSKTFCKRQERILLGGMENLHKEVSLCNLFEATIDLLRNSQLGK